MTTQTAEEYALGVLRRHRDSMTRPDFQIIADDAALSAREVQDLWEKLLAGRVPKPLDRPRAVPAAPGSPVTVTAVPHVRPVEAPPSWLTAKDHPSPRIRGKYKRAMAAVADLEAALAKEAEKDKLREKEARLAAQLAKVREELRGGVSMKPARDRSSGLVPCPDCGEQVTTQGLGVHRARSKTHKAAIG